ncbi:MAG: hypothetical protein LIO65_07640, partial [Odoribacter sp.]|nr:hypothetical protein [Odoribacter sp.]
MYLIVSETANSLTESERYLNDFLAARNLSPVTINNENEKTDYILKEYRKEFYAEGQMFLQYKRLFWQDLLWTPKTGSRSLYEIPLPDGEI